MLTVVKKSRQLEGSLSILTLSQRAIMTPEDTKVSLRQKCREYPSQRQNIVTGLKTEVGREKQECHGGKEQGERFVEQNIFLISKLTIGDGAITEFPASLCNCADTILWPVKCLWTVLSMLISITIQLGCRSVLKYCA